MVQSISRRRKMERKGNRDVKTNISLPIPSSSDLRGRQSVRATFKLTERAINTINIVATHLGIKQKSLFDHLIADFRSLNLIADEIQTEQFEQLDRVQKTFVISRKTLVCLGEVARKFGAPRDALVEYSVQRLLPIIAEERERHRKRKEILCELNKFLKRGEEILERSRRTLSDEDPVYDKLKGAISICRNAVGNIRSFIKKGEVIENFDQDDMDDPALVGYG
jgi:hypothetical protein